MACGGLRRRPSERPSPQPCPCSVLPAWCSCLVLPALCSPQPRPHPVLPAQCSPPGSPAWCSLHGAPRSPAQARFSPHSAPRLVLPPSAPAWCFPHGAPCSPAWAQCSPHSAPCPRLVLPAQRSHTCTWVLGGRSTLLVPVLASGGHPREWMPWLLPAPGRGTAGKRLSLPHLPGEAPHWLTSAPCSRSAMCMALTQQRAAGWGGGPRCSPSPRTCRAVLVTVERALGL